jgi:hypothetical protein
MPAAYDIYADQLREIRRGQALYYPEPSPDEGPVEIGDVGYTRQGAFCRLFNVSRAADDSAQLLGVPEGFRPLNMGRIRHYDAALEPGPLHSRTIFRVNADIGTPGYAALSFEFVETVKPYPYAEQCCPPTHPSSFHARRLVARFLCLRLG